MDQALDCMGIAGLWEGFSFGTWQQDLHCYWFKELQRIESRLKYRYMTYTPRNTTQKAVGAINSGIYF